jgi:hypothetical protein
MDFLPKSDHAPTSRPSARSNGRSSGPDREQPAGQDAAAARNQEMDCQPTSTPRTWIIFLPSVLLVIALIAAFRSDAISGRSCAMTIGTVLTVYNVGAFLQKLLDRAVPKFGGTCQVIRGTLPLAALLGWLRPSTESGFLDQAIQLTVVATMIALGARLFAAWFHVRLGGTWPAAIRIAFCIYLAILYVGTVVVNVPAMGLSGESVFALIVAASALLLFWADGPTTIPIQVVSVTYTLALLDARSDSQRMTTTLLAAGTLLVLLLAVAVAIHGMLKVGKK